MTSHVDHITRTTPLCKLCGKREAKCWLNPAKQKSRKAHRGGRYRLKAHDTCSVCWRRLCAQYWVH